MKDVLVAIGIVIALFVFGVVCKGISLYNTHVDLLSRIEAQQKANETVFDNMWKKISQTTQVADKYKDGLKGVLVSYAEGRSKNSDQLLMDWTKEAVPNFDASLYKQINNIVASSRDDFTNSQKLLIDLSRQHNTMIRRFPNNVFCAVLHIEPIEIKVVTSSKTDKAFETQKEDDVRL